MTTQTENHMSIGRRLMAHADDQFARGDFLQASEKAWGATAHFLKAHAAPRGLAHSSHYDLRQVADYLEKETGAERIGELFSICESVHSNYYEAWMSENVLERRLANVKELITLLEEIPMPSGAATPNGADANNGERQYFVTRSGEI